MRDLLHKKWENMLNSAVRISWHPSKLKAFGQEKQIADANSLTHTYYKGEIEEENCEYIEEINDPAFYEPHLEFEGELFSGDCFE